mmetsp:Transcript_14133/g.16827  ORF Transcript_14133/g.16827 Transcript_14133/m.16827 type:complete len:120 (+) Transcript_14133:486-845(+)|eukprot:CAMPEP_0170468332 /NCGR_PEP_ID=MMETSP0123-20130129/11555_1 /TAXON_ID=182087 /ORGANISM="Favella ehrenbergii, Strain Fehren 1" /LENGTH=119 /DNA_ID=CAMNT_0010734881 /DNA_START=416 /DNA_END=775 /DNA_ORIENTATION=+
MTGLAIWGAVALNSNEAQEFEDALPNTGLPAFVNITHINVIMGFLYSCSHICALPIGLCLASCFSERVRFYMATRREFAHMNDNENPFAQDEEMQNQVREHRREQAERAMSQLNVGNYT